MDYLLIDYAYQPLAYKDLWKELISLENPHLFIISGGFINIFEEQSKKFNVTEIPIFSIDDEKELFINLK